MKHFTSLLIAAAILVSCTQENKSLTDYVDPFIGTAFHGHTYPGATTPFGMVQLSPDNFTNDWDACSGYHYDQKQIIGFSHTHISGTGCADLGDILFHPTCKAMDINGEGPAYELLSYRHRDEVAEPGYYSVTMRKEGLKAELTATQHTGWHRYFWAKNKPHNLIIDMMHTISDERIDTVEIFQTAPNEIRGMRKTTGWTPNHVIYFVAQFSRDFESIEVNGRQAAISFGCTGGQVVAKVGISMVSYDNAEFNLVKEGGIEAFNFDQIRKDARELWNSCLGCIQTKGGTEQQKRTFYTALYHTAIVPNTIADCNGQFVRQDGSLSSVRFGKEFYSTLSLWDTFRAWLPLATMIYPAIAHDIAYSCLDTYNATGMLPLWPLASGETECMIGYHSIPFIVDAFIKGLLPELDVNYALEAMVRSSNINAKGSDLYIDYGYIPADKRAESVSCTLEYAYDDWCIARFAEIIGNAEIATEYYRRAGSYAQLFDGSTGFFRGKRADGTFIDPFITTTNSREYTEATPWQYRYFVPHDFAGLANLLGGREQLAQALDDCFTAPQEVLGGLADISGLIGQYAHGNEPSHHMAYIYNYVGQAWKTQEWTRRICKEMYTDKPDGICGNEDCGQMSAWYLMSALGLYEVCPGTGEFTLTSPLFEEATISIAGGKTLTIKANDPARNRYIRSVSLNGERIDNAFVSWEQLIGGGELCFELCSQPDKTLWTGTDAAPYSMSDGLQASKPYYTADDCVEMFRDEVSISLGCLSDGATIRYTTDGSEPTATSQAYTEPLHISSDTRIRALAFAEGMKCSQELDFMATRAEYAEAVEIEGLSNGVHYDFYHGDFHKIADITACGEYVGSGTLEDIMLTPADQEDYYGFVFKGYIYIPEDGMWTMGLKCDDGGVLRIGGRLIVDNDGTHAATMVTGKALLRKGFHPFEIPYLESYEGQEITLFWERDGQLVKVPAENLFYR